MEEVRKRTDELEKLRGRLLAVNSAGSLLRALSAVENVPIALSTTEDVTDGTGLSMSFSVICTGVKIVNRVMCLTSDDGFTAVQLNLGTVRKVRSKLSADKEGVVMKLTLKNGAEFLMMFHLESNSSAMK